MFPRPVRQYARAQRLEVAAALASVLRSWSRMSTNFDQDWPLVAVTIAQTITVAQGRVLEPVPNYVSSSLRATGQRVPDQVFTPDLRQFVGVTGAGISVPDALRGAIARTKLRVAEGMTARAALANTGSWLTRLTGTVLADTSRGAEQLVMKSRDVDWYVRMVSGPSCGRCVILAGVKYRTERAFDRHPGCDCRHVPVSERDAAKDLVVSLDDYLEGADDADLARLFGSKANAQAFRDGADPNQLINAYRKGSQYATLAEYDGKTWMAKATRESSSRRGYAGRLLPAKAPRVMPESIYRMTKGDKAETDRLLRLHGWIF